MMFGWYEVTGLLIALILRLGIPIGLTVLFTLWLRKLDVRWKAEAEQQSKDTAYPEILSLRAPCWETQGCSSEQREKCPAFQIPQTACWQVFRNEKDGLRQDCLVCQVFLTAPVPFVIHETKERIRISQPKDRGGDL